MATYRYVVYDVLNTFKQVFDDATINPSQVLFWVNVVANRLRKQHQDKHDTGEYLTIFSDLKVKKDTTLHNRHYIELPARIFDLDNEKGVKYITYNLETLDCCFAPEFTQVFFQRTTPDKSHRLYLSKYEKPNIDNPYFYRVGDKIYFLGTECHNLSSVEIGLVTAFNTTITCQLDDEIPLPPDLIQVLILEVRNLGRLSLIVPKDNTNEGVDNTNDELRQRQLNVPVSNSVVPNEQEGGGQ